MSAKRSTTHSWWRCGSRIPSRGLAHLRHRGAGATEVELARAIAARAADAPPPFPETLSLKATAALERLGVQVRTGLIVKDINNEGVTFQGPDGVVHLNAHTSSGREVSTPRPWDGSWPSARRRRRTRVRPDWDIAVRSRGQPWERGEKAGFHPYGKTQAQVLAEPD